MKKYFLQKSFSEAQVQVKVNRRTISIIHNQAMSFNNKIARGTVANCWEFQIALIQMFMKRNEKYFAQLWEKYNADQFSLRTLKQRLNIDSSGS